jgi:hypothetical protein
MKDEMVYVCDEDIINAYRIVIGKPWRGGGGDITLERIVKVWVSFNGI